MIRRNAPASTVRGGPGGDRAAGWLLAAIIALAAYVIQYLPVPPFRIVDETTGAIRYPVGAAIIAIVLGAALRNLVRLPSSVSVGCHEIVRHVIPVSIVLIGAGLNLAVLRAIGAASLVIVILSIVLALVTAWLAGRSLKLTRKTSVLLGAGTAICGSSAIVSIAPLIKASQRDLVLAVGAVNLLGLTFMLLLPPIGAALGMSPEAFGIWAGASVHAVPQALAAGFAYPDAGEVATLVKLVRVTMLAPLVIVISFAVANRSGGMRSIRFSRLVPWFIWGFLAMSVVNTVVQTTDWIAGDAGINVRRALSELNWLGTVLLTLAMAAIGLEVNLREIAGVGSRALLATMIASIVLAAGSLALIGVLL